MEAVIPHPLGLSRLAELICEDRSTRKVRQVGQGVAVVGDGEWLTLGEVVERLNSPTAGRYNIQRVRRLADAGFLLVDRMPAIGVGATHRRIKATSVDEYEAASKLAEPERTSRLAALQRKNQSPPTDA